MSVSECLDCGSGFAAFRWRYNCQACGHGPVCKKCCSYAMPAFQAASETHSDASSKSGPAQICKSCFKKFGDEASRGKQSERVINEIFQTEQSYCKNLRLVDDIYARHFGQDIAQSPKPKSKSASASISPCSATLMFTAWHQLTTLHEDFLNGLSAVMKNKGNVQTPPSSPKAKAEATTSPPPPRGKPLVPSMSIHVCLVPTSKGEIGCRFMPLGAGAATAIAALAGHCIALLVEHITPGLPAGTCREMQVMFCGCIDSCGHMLMVSV